MWWMVPLIGGAALAMQTGANAAMAARLQSAVSSACLSFVTGTIVLALAVMLTGSPTPTRAIHATPWTWAGGALGAIYVASAAAAAPKLGAGTTVALVLAGQLVTAVILDHYGLLGFVTHSVSLQRFAGVALIIGGVVLVKVF